MVFCKARFDCSQSCLPDWYGYTLFRNASSLSGQRVLLVVHGGVLHALHHHLMGHAHHGPLANCSMHTVRVEGRKWAVLSWNQTMHLAGVGFLGQGPVVAVAGAAITGSTKGSLPAGAGGFDSLNDRL